MLQVVGTQCALAGISDTVGSTDGIVDHGAGHQLSAILQRGSWVLAAVKLGNFLYTPSIMPLGNAGSKFSVVGTQCAVVAVGDTIGPTDLLQDEGAGCDGFAAWGISQVCGAIKWNTLLLASSIVAFPNVSPILYVMGTDATLVVISKSVCATDWEQDPWAAYHTFTTIKCSCRVLTAVDIRNLLLAFSVVLLADMGPLLYVVGADPALVIICEAICATNWIQDPWTGY